MDDFLGRILSAANSEEFTRMRPTRLWLTGQQAREASEEHQQIEIAIAGEAGRDVLMLPIDTGHVIGFVELDFNGLTVNGLLFKRIGKDNWWPHAFGTYASRIDYNEFHEAILQIYKAGRQEAASDE
jgi:hypothetical protein